MSAFTLDTSGEIVLPYPNLHPHPRGIRWSDLSPFEQGYVEAVFASLRRSPLPRDHADLLLSDGTPRKIGVVVGHGGIRTRVPKWRRDGGWCVWDSGWMPIEANPQGRGYRIAASARGFRHLAPETLSAIKSACAEFQASQAWRGYVGGALSNPGVIDHERCGQMFWNERQKRAGGFVGAFAFPQEYAARLHERAEIFPPLTVTLSEAGKVVFS